MRHFARYVILAPFAPTLLAPTAAQTIPSAPPSGDRRRDAGMLDMSSQHGRIVPTAAENADQLVPFGI